MKNCFFDHNEFDTVDIFDARRAKLEIDFVTYKLRALSKGLLLVVCMTTKCA